MNNIDFNEENGLKLSRSFLFTLIVSNFDMIESFFDVKMVHNLDFVKTVFEDSAKICQIFEKDIGKVNNYSQTDLLKKLSNALKQLKDESFREYLKSSIIELLFKKNEKAEFIKYNETVVVIFKQISIYQNKILTACLKPRIFNNNYSTNKPQTFLSYAYVDKGLSLGLFMYFIINGGFLYVNWMWSGSNPNSSITKNELNNALCNSSSFLFLRSLNSELNYYGSSQIRQWCSWELGNYYTKKPNSKYYINLYGNSIKSNDLLTTLNQFHGISNGIIY